MLEESRALGVALDQSKREADKAASEYQQKAVELERLEQERKVEEATVTDLQRQLEEAETPRVGSVVGSPVAAGTNKEQVFFELFDNRVLEVTKSHYNVETFRGPNGPVAVLTRSASGEGEIEIASSDFAKRLNELTPGGHALALIVHSDSFVAFRKVRDIARARRIEVGWEPYVREDGKLVFSSGGREVNVQP